MSAYFFDPESSLGFMTITANRLMGILFRKRLAAAGLDVTPEQWGVLIHLWNQGGVPQEALAQTLCVDKSSLSRVLAGMERKGLIERRRDAADGRRKLLYATPTADALKEDCRAVATKALEQMFRGISPEEEAACRKTLATVKDTIRDIMHER